MCYLYTKQKKSFQHLNQHGNISYEISIYTFNYKESKYKFTFKIRKVLVAIWKDQGKKCSFLWAAILLNWSLSTSEVGEKGVVQNSNFGGMMSWSELLNYHLANYAKPCGFINQMTKGWFTLP